MTTTQTNSVDYEALAATRAAIAETCMAPDGERRPSTARGIHHVAFLSSDVQRTVDFYQGILGFPLVEVMENRDYPGSTHFFFDLGQGNLLAFFDFPGLDLSDYAEVLGGLHHLAIAVSARKWETLKTRLTEHGIPWTVHSDVSVYFTDPDGARLELLADPLGGSTAPTSCKGGRGRACPEEDVVLSDEGAPLPRPTGPPRVPSSLRPVPPAYAIRTDGRREDGVATLKADLGPDYVQSLERGLAVLRCFSGERPSLTLSEVAEAIGLTRATARRLLLTLAGLGHVRLDGRAFSLTPQVLCLGYAYLSSLGIGDLAQGPMKALVDQVQESSSASVLDGDDIVYVARVPTSRLMTVSAGLGKPCPPTPPRWDGCSWPASTRTASTSICAGCGSSPSRPTPSPTRTSSGRP